jgi:hypothetical protein
VAWFAVDDRFWSHRKIMKMRRSPAYAEAVALWVLAGSWCCSQDGERFSGKVPLDVVASFGVPGWRDGLDLLVDVGLFEVPDGECAAFHDWDAWNGVGGKEYRSKEQARIRQQNHRLKKCQNGTHSKDCPPETCPKKLARRSRHTASRDTGSGRAGSGRVEVRTATKKEQEERW